MTKARTKGQRRRQRQRAITLPGGETAPQRPTGRDRRHINQPQEPADLIAIAARVKRYGCTAEDAKRVIFGDDIGACVWRIYPDKAKQEAVFSVWCEIGPAWHNFCTRVLGKTHTPQAAALPILPDSFEAGESLRVDERTADEKDAAAVRVWKAWGKAFNKLAPEQALAIAGASYGIGRALWDADARKPTKAGHLAVEALAALHAARTA